MQKENVFCCFLEMCTIYENEIDQIRRGWGF